MYTDWNQINVAVECNSWFEFVLEAEQAMKESDRVHLVYYEDLIEVRTSRLRTLRLM